MTTSAVSEVVESPISDLKWKGFKVYQISGPASALHAHSRRDFYKIVLVNSDLTVSYGDKTVDIKETCLILVNPRIAHTVTHHNERKGFACVFTEAFMAGRERTELLHNSPLFRFGLSPIIPLDAEQLVFITGIYQKMLSVYHSDYEQKDELLKTCTELLIREALMIKPLSDVPKYKNAATRIAHLFLELQERQFPIENTGSRLKLRTAQDYAESLAVHVNYLNRAVKEVTGKPTSVHIAERIAAEAKALLQHTDWSVGEIAYSLGFEYPTYFNNYFKRVTGLTPKYFRPS